ncbi:2-hydroxyacid dehydrogenase [Ancylobacter mangrovi]|uniref:2-hydroxyacid dehydrogenase n=1 Tax=Ancylobacter mangrovi TaxID=2972472 RepID=UPI002161CA05|nr:2-hydroxyacid dehydrogenase [Ancylobacter mangrovi]MCS0503712.1 2-hydroxyacid dehydrogenase [Ancylobacter mangrovi]
MANLVVGIIDPFHPKILEMIASGIPDDWSLSIAADQSAEEKARALGRADIAFVMAAPMPASLLREAPKLRFIQKLGAGVDRIDLDFCAAHDITVARLQAGNSIPVAEHTLLLMLAACRRLPYLDRQTRAGGWDKEAARGNSRQIHGRTVGIVGFGAIGKAVARLLSGFGAELLYYDPLRADLGVERELGVAYASLDEITARADILSLHLPLTRDTAKLFDAARIASLKPGAILINCARGGLVDEKALHEALVEGRVYAAGLDAFEAEPPVGNPLLTLDQTVVTPHVAGGTVDNFAPVLARAIGNARRFLHGQNLPEEDLVPLPPRTAA